MSAEPLFYEHFASAHNVDASGEVLKGFGGIHLFAHQHALNVVDIDRGIGVGSGENVFDAAGVAYLIERSVHECGGEKRVGHDAHHFVVDIGKECGHTVFKGVFLIDIPGLARYFA